MRLAAFKGKLFLRQSQKFRLLGCSYNRQHKSFFFPPPFLEIKGTVQAGERMGKLTFPIIAMFHGEEVKG